MNPQNKKIKVLLVIIIALVSYIGFRIAVRHWAKNYNTRQWISYLEAFKDVKKTAEPIMACKNELESIKKAILPIYEEAILLKSRGGNLTDSQLFYVDMYRTLDDIVDGLENRISYYEQDQPEIQSGMFFILGYKGKYQKLTLRDIIDRKPKTIESLNWYLNDFKEDSKRIEQINCADFSSLSFDYPLSIDTCKALVDLEVSYGNKPFRDPEDTDVEYQIKLERYQKELDAAYKECENGNLYSRLGRFW